MNKRNPAQDSPKRHPGSTRTRLELGPGDRVPSSAQLSGEAHEQVVAPQFGLRKRRHGVTTDFDAAQIVRDGGHDDLVLTGAGERDPGHEAVRSHEGIFP